LFILEGTGGSKKPQIEEGQTTQWPKEKKRQNYNYQQIDFDFCCLMPLSAIFQLYHGDQFSLWKKPEYSERTINHGQATDKLYLL
jgi:hypothetical protein